MEKSRENELLVKGAQAEVAEILKEFDGQINADITEVTINKTITRKATLKDQVEFMRGCWNDAKQYLADIGIEVE
ncbi:MAG: hypothetical protein AB9844_09315 [Clostridiaceae bacterium]